MTETNSDTTGDRELLEMAAKAAGLQVEPCVNGWDECYPLGWRPLSDDGDALRLAVKLRLDVCISVCRVGGEDGWYNDLVEEIGIEAATRRAIVRAAASIGAAL